MAWQRRLVRTATLALLLALSAYAHPVELTVRTTTVKSCDDWLNIYAQYWGSFPQCQQGVSSRQCCELYDLMDKSIQIFRSQLRCTVTNLEFFRNKFRQFCTGSAAEDALADDTAPAVPEGVDPPSAPRPDVGVGEGGHGDADGIVILDDGSTQVEGEASVEVTPNSGHSGTSGHPGYVQSGYVTNSGVTTGTATQCVRNCECCQCCGCCTTQCGHAVRLQKLIRSGNAGGGRSGSCCRATSCHRCRGCGGCSGGGGGCGGGYVPVQPQYPNTGVSTTPVGTQSGSANTGDTNVVDANDSDDERDPVDVDDGSVCFSADAQVLLRDGSSKRMDKVEIGDSVHVGHGEYSEVFAFTHRDSSAYGRFVVLQTGHGDLVATEGHFVHSSRGVIDIAELKVGDEVELACGTRVDVRGVGGRLQRGLYNPQTLQGDIVVDGFRATTYTKAVPSLTAHTLLTPVRGLYQLCGAACGDLSTRVLFGVATQG